MRRMWAVGTAIAMCLAPGGVPAAAQEASSQAEWAAVTGTNSCGLGQAGVVQMDTPPYSWTNFILKCVDKASDLRVSGPSTVVLSIESWDGREGLNSVAWWDYTIQGPDGTWAGHGYGLYDGDGVLHQLSILAGSGAYQGLTYTIAGTIPAGSGNSEYSGLILPGSPPPGFPVMPFPEPTPSPSPASPSPASALATIGLPADDGARIVAVDELDARTRDLTIESPSVGTQRVRLLLPAGFDPGAEARWPVLYLLHGAGNDYTSWTRETDVETLTADLPLLVVMPEAGWDGWYADWWNGGAGGAPMWETFHTGELPELLERNWGAADERAVAGLSMGGLGAMSYAARHPGLFRAAASFSGMLQPVTLDPSIVGFDVPPDLWGDRTEQADVWAAHDPVELATALAGTALYVSYGNGEPGPLDAAEAGFDELEASSAAMNEAFVARLAELDIPVTVETGPGTHTMPYVERGLRGALPILLEALGLGNVALGVGPAPAQGGATAVTGTAVTGTSECQGVSDGTTETVDGVVRVSGMVVRCTDTASDPRMSGTTTLTLDWQQYGSHYLYWGTRETEGPDGTWAGTFIGRSDDVDTETQGWMTNVLEGTGDYAGSTYVSTDHVLFPDGTSEDLPYEGPPPPFGPLPSPASE